VRARTPALGGEHCATALLLIDRINHFEFPARSNCFERRPVAAAAAQLKEAPRAHRDALELIARNTITSKIPLPAPNPSQRGAR
jgi:hypothetical protein